MRSVYAYSPSASAEILRDGSRVTIRPIRTGDIGAECEFFLPQFPELRRYRFLGSIASPSELMLKRLTDLDEATEAAFVALTVEMAVPRDVGVARMSAVGDGARSWQL